MTRRVRMALALGGAATLAVLSTSATARPLGVPGPERGATAAAAELRVVQHNTDHVPAAWDVVVQEVEEQRPDLVTVQEVCRPWFEELRSEHPGWTFAYHPRKRHFGNSRNPGCGGDFIGELVIHTGAANRPTLTPDYPNNNADGVEKFGIACVEFRRTGIPTLGCSTHLSAFPTSGGRGTQPEREPQVRAIVDLTAPYRERGWAVVVGGDLNMTSSPDNPNQSPVMDLVLGPAVGGIGDFYDGAQHDCACRLTDPTTDKGNRIDYVLWSSGRTPFPGSASTDTVDTPAGHHLLRSVGTLAR
ncbi:endonuclease/exonuclease/phosphatase family protein [Knoellia locipacati]|uniref:endonuclease/exonuclease/phosphatase family protein n=1 Tax=Knoellia locipacati TaxID=882824 RepID=UPI00384F10DA